MKKALKEFSGDYRIMRVVLASSNPLDTIHKIRTDQYSIVSLLDLLEYLDMKETIEENETQRMRMQQAQASTKGGGR